MRARARSPAAFHNMPANRPAKSADSERYAAAPPTSSNAPTTKTCGSRSASVCPTSSQLANATMIAMPATASVMRNIAMGETSREKMMAAPPSAAMAMDASTRGRCRSTLSPTNTPIMASAMATMGSSSSTTDGVRILRPCGPSAMPIISSAGSDQIRIMVWWRSSRARRHGARRHD